MNTLQLLRIKLLAAGIPVIGVSGNEPPYRVDFTSEVTQQQRESAAAIVAAFDPIAEQAAEDAEHSNRKTVATQLETELAWLDTNIPLIDGMTATQVRSVVKRLAQESRGIIQILVWLEKHLD